MIEAVIFDFGQTLVDSADGFRVAEREAQARIFADLNLTSRGEFLESYRRLRRASHEQSMLSRAAIWQAVYAHFQREPDLRCLAEWEREYWEQVETRTTAFPEAEAVLSELSGRYRLALITNTQGQTTSGEHRLSRFPELERLLETVVIAGQGGIPPKPDPAPFLVCLERLGLVPAEAVHVGDDWRVDIGGAQGAGIRPVWLKHHLVERNWPVVDTGAPVITSLEPLLGIEELLSPC